MRMPDYDTGPRWNSRLVLVPNHQEAMGGAVMTFIQALTEAGLLEDFKDICTPDITDKEAMQRVRRREQMKPLEMHIPKDRKSIRYVRAKLGCPSKTTHGGKRKNSGGKADYTGKRKEGVWRKSFGFDFQGEARRARRYAPTDDTPLM